MKFYQDDTPKKDFKTICLITRYYPPDKGALPRRAVDMVSHLTKKGHKVIILTTVPSYPEGLVNKEYRKNAFYIEKGKGHLLVRLTTLFYTKHIFLRFLADLIFTLMLSLGILALRRRLSTIDAFLITYPPPFVALLTPLLYLYTNSKIYFEIRDLWSEVLILEYISNKKSLILRLFMFLESIGSKYSHGTITVTPNLVEKIKFRLKNNNLNRPVYYIPNGVDLEVFTPINTINEYTSNSKPREFIIIYSGSISGAYCFEQALHALKIALDQFSNIKFLIIGNGDRLNHVINLVKKLKLYDNVVFLPSMPTKQLLKYIRCSDIGLVPLHPNETDALPVKLFEYLACNLPVIASSSYHVRELLEESKAGLFVSINNVEEFANSILFLLSNDEIRKQMGLNGRTFLTGSIFDKNKSMKRLEKILTAL